MLSPQGGNYNIWGEPSVKDIAGLARAVGRRDRHRQPDLEPRRHDSASAGFVRIAPRRPACHRDDELEQKSPGWARPLHHYRAASAEGGAHNLSPRAGANCFSASPRTLRFVDVELRSAAGVPVLVELGAELEVEAHHFRPRSSANASPASCACLAARRKIVWRSIFKIVTRTDTPAQLARLLEFFGQPGRDLPVSAMGIGSWDENQRVRPGPPRLCAELTFALDPAD